jgi:hypothetical protein
MIETLVQSIGDRAGCDFGHVNFPTWQIFRL